jgi:hypothetical protein
MKTLISNVEFISTIFPKNANVAVCSKKSDPTEGSWLPQLFSGYSILGDESNNYVNSSSFQFEEDDVFNVQKKNFKSFNFVLLDDLGTKVQFERLGDFETTWVIETSPGNFQAGIALKEPITNMNEAEVLQKSILDAGYGDRGAGGVSRWARLPNAINGKEKYLDEDGNPFQCKLTQWNPETRYTVQELIDGLQITAPEVESEPHYDNEVYTPKAFENRVIAALKERSLYKTPLGSGKYDITCPWVHEHTDQLDSGTAYFEPSEGYALGGFSCLHSHAFGIRDLLKFLEVEVSDARNKPTIKLRDGELHNIVDAAEKALADSGKYYQMGGLIVCVVTEPTTGTPSILPVKQPALTRDLSFMLSWEKFDVRSKSWKPCDPPQRHVGILYDSQQFNHLPHLKGVARQPYFDGELVTEAGYNVNTKLFGVFDSRKYNIPAVPTEEAAKAAMTLVENLIDEFHFAKPVDKSAALSAIFTATTRTALDFAPAFHIKASTYGVGKSLLCAVVATFASASGSNRVSYPTTSEEATKIILSLLLTNPAVIEFDDLDNDLIPHNIIKSVLTSDTYAGRILGYSKTASVSTRTLFLSSGNNVDPVRDLIRRVVTVNLDAGVETPATMTYKKDPLEMIHQNRELYVSAVLTVIAGWIAAGSPKADVKNIATYGGNWSNFCRHPLMWLGLPDPATPLFEQMANDPDAKKLFNVMSAWYRRFGSKSTQVRQVTNAFVNGGSTDLYDAICEFPVEERGSINPSKLGWMLKRNANKIVNGYKLEKVEESERIAWRVIQLDLQTA